MSEFFDKISKGMATTSEDWMNYLVEAHEIFPGMTPYVFAEYATQEGLNSYEVLAKTLAPFKGRDVKVLDLACGDGHLTTYLLGTFSPQSQIVGLDMSEAELALAKKIFTDPRVSFVLGKAQDMPFEAQSFDVVFCHMAFMLMSPIEPVIKEIARILKPGGVFAAVTSSRLEGSEFWQQVCKVKYSFIDRRYPKLRDAKAGDRRVYSTEGLKSLFTQSLGFTEVNAFEDFAIEMPATPDLMWEFMKDTYFASMLPAAEKVEHEKEFKDYVSKHPYLETHKTYQFPMQKFTVTKG
jgi:ubiquinone/menaquinone biosynthesis C-methylase UbiE